MLIDVNDIKLNIELMGCELNEQHKLITDKPVLIAVPGGPGFSHTLLKPGLNSLSEHFSLIYLDPRGTGKSDLCDESSWTIQQQAEDIVALCQTLGVQKSVLLGYSVGSHYAAFAAALAPEYISGLILLNGITANKETLFNNLIRLGGNTAKRLMIDLDLSAFPEYAEKVLPLYNPVLRPDEHAETLEMNLEQCMFMLHECFDKAILPALQALSINTLFLLGKLDPLDPAADAIKRIEKLSDKNIQTEVFDQSGHDILLCEQEKLIQKILNFMNARSGE